MKTNAVLKKTIILFDLDGTLINSTEAINESFDYSFSCMNKGTCDKEILHSLIGYTLWDIFLKLGIKKENIQIGIDFYKEKYREISNKKTFLLDGAKESVQLAHNFAVLGIVTTKTSTYSIELLKHLGIYEYFNVVIGFNDVANPKPHPEPIQKAMKALQANKQTTWMIGDTTFDTKCALNAGVKSIGLLCGHGIESDMREHTKFICNNSKEAVEFIKNYNH